VKYLVIRGREALIGLGSNDAEPQPDDA
jgi:hypothetical protein